MNITYGNVVLFKNVCYGEVFKYCDDIYMKFRNEEVKAIKNSVSLITGETYLFRPNDEVELLNTRLIIGG